MGIVLVVSLAEGQTRPAAIPPELTGRTVEQVRILGRTRPLTAELLAQISNQVRTREGTRFDPLIVEGDYQRVYGLRRFSNVEARVEPTEAGVIVIFEVTEQNTISEIRFVGNQAIDTQTLQNAIGIKVGQSVDPFRLALAREAIQRLYQQKNFPHTFVDVDEREAAQSGVVLFTVVEGARVRVRGIKVVGNRTFSDARIRGQARTRAWFPFFVPGTFDGEQLEQDVASIRQFYEERGFFDVRVGRKVVVGPDQKEVMIEFLIEEGQRYVVDRVSFRGNESIGDEQLLAELNLTPGRFYDRDLVRRDIRQIIRAYSPLGVIYDPSDLSPDPDYLSIREERLFRREAGKVEIVYNISEGRSFLIGEVKVRGNERIQDKVFLREMRIEPGGLYNAGEVQNAPARIRATGLVQNVTITPIVPSQPPDGPLPTRDLLVDVTEGPTARLLLGAGISSNAGLLGNITYEQRNFDIGNVPSSFDELFSSRAFTGAGQTFRIQLEPGTQATRARVDFVEPWIFDQPYSFGVSGYIQQRRRLDWSEYRVGGRTFLGRRFGDVWSARLTLRAEDVEVGDIRNDALRAPEVLLLEGHSTLITPGIEVRRDTTDNPLLPSRGSVTVLAWEHSGLLGGDFDYDKFTLSWNRYFTIYEDLLDRRTTLSLRTDAGYISGDAPFFERFYGGGIGSVRGFRYRGISPRSGIDEDPIGGDFLVNGTLELNFPIAGDALRGVLFTDAGTVQRDFEFGTIRTSVGFGFRLSLPFFGQLPLAVDFGFPITKDDQDDIRIFSFTLGNVP
jgi:outer membrane protein insertion porin family